jgi:hypothetical protein
MIFKDFFLTIYSFKETFKNKPPLNTIFVNGVFALIFFKKIIILSVKNFSAVFATSSKR